MNCLHCGGNLKRSDAPLRIDRDTIHIQLDHVPAWVCEQCGEPLFEGETVEVVQAIALAVEAESSKLQRSA